MFLIPEALAADSVPVQAMVQQFLPLVLIFVAFWFFIIRPQKKRQQEHTQMIEALKKGDDVMTIGGLCGRVEGLEENAVLLAIASVDGKLVTIRMNRSSVQTVLPQGTLSL